MLENSTAGLYMLDPAREVTVTREEDHQHVLARYPVTHGYSRRVAVELGWCTAAKGKHKGQRAIEVRLDGDRVGELTNAMTQRYASLVETVMAVHGRPGCEATISSGDRGLQIELHMPPAGATLAPPRAVPVPTPTPTPRPAPVLTPVPTYDHTAYAPAPTPKKSRVPLAFAGAVVGMVAVISGIASIGEDTPSANNTVITVTTTVAPPTTTIRITTTKPQPTTTRPKPTTTTKPKPKPTTAKPAPAPPPPPETTESDCDPNYSGCVPIASDVDCAGGSGNGPAYVAGPVRVIGTDIYELDRDNDGLGCE